MKKLEKNTCQFTSDAKLIIDEIETRLLGRKMSGAMRTALLDVHTAYSGRESDGVKAIVQIVAASPEFSVDR